MTKADICLEKNTHAALKADPNAWASLKRIGIQEDGCGGRYELKNCSFCSSSLAMEVTT